MTYTIFKTDYRFLKTFLSIGDRTPYTVKRNKKKSVSEQIIIILIIE